MRAEKGVAAPPHTVWDAYLAMVQMSHRSCTGHEHPIEASFVIGPALWHQQCYPVWSCLRQVLLSGHGAEPPQPLHLSGNMTCPPAASTGFHAP